MIDSQPFFSDNGQVTVTSKKPNGLGKEDKRTPHEKQLEQTKETLDERTT
jgi:hypothetical protein